MKVDPNPEPTPAKCCGSAVEVTNGINEDNDSWITRWEYQCNECGSKYIDPR